MDQRTLENRHVADSWEDEEAATSESDTEILANKSSIPEAPPPTPISPSGQSEAVWGGYSSANSSVPVRVHSSSLAQSPSSRPEKSTAAAGRMIAGALGMKPPKKSEEALAYDRAIQDKELKRIARAREERKAAEQRREQASRKVWDD